MRRRTWILTGLAVVLLFLAYAGWSVWQVRSDLTEARSSAARLRVALVDGDQHRAEQALESLQDTSGAAAGRTDGPLWAVFGAMPGLGDDARGVRTVASVLDDVSHDGLDPLVASADSLDSGTFTPVNGQIPVDSVAVVAKPLGAARDSFAAADKELGGVDSSGFTGAFGSAYDDLSGQIHRANKATAAATTAAELLPGMLGGDGPRNYLLIFQNNAEARSTGGLPGAATIMNTTDGKISISKEARAPGFPELAKPVLPLTKEENKIFFEQLGTYFQDANFTPDFPRTADLMAARWKLETGQDLDGVVSVDPVAMGYLLEATGPVTVDGVTLTGDNAADELMNKAYLRLPDPMDQDRFFSAVSRTVFEKFSSGAGTPQVVLEGLARGAEERRLLVHSFDEAEQQRLAGTKIAGELPSVATARPQVGVYMNDGTGSKMSYYLDYDVAVRSEGCQDDAQKLAGEMTLSSNTPPNIKDVGVSVTGRGDEVVPRGNQLVIAHVYGPVDGSIDEVKLDGKKLDVTLEKHVGRDVASMVFFFKPGQKRAMTWTMTTGAGQTEGTDVTVSPGVQPENESSTAAGC
ncbi:MAG: DUF4012 domain-containing protein [Nocardioides sp.]